jgi:hypothetical protein
VCSSTRYCTANLCALINTSVRCQYTLRQPLGPHAPTGHDGKILIFDGQVLIDQGPLQARDYFVDAYTFNNHGYGLVFSNPPICGLIFNTF